MSLIINLPKDFPILLIDEERIRQVISNLLSNAIKYSPGGKILINSQILPEKVILCVHDEGPGISQDDLPHVFDRFYRCFRCG